MWASVAPGAFAFICADDQRHRPGRTTRLITKARVGPMACRKSLVRRVIHIERQGQSPRQSARAITALMQIRLGTRAVRWATTAAPKACSTPTPNIDPTRSSILAHRLSRGGMQRGPRPSPIISTASTRRAGGVRGARPVPQSAERAGREAGIRRPRWRRPPSGPLSPKRDAAPPPRRAAAEGWCRCRLFVRTDHARRATAGAAWRPGFPAAESETRPRFQLPQSPAVCRFAAKRPDVTPTAADHGQRRRTRRVSVAHRVLGRPRRAARAVTGVDWQPMTAEARGPAKGAEGVSFKA